MAIVLCFVPQLPKESLALPFAEECKPWLKNWKCTCHPAEHRFTSALLGNSKFVNLPSVGLRIISAAQGWNHLINNALVNSVSPMEKLMTLIANHEERYELERGPLSSSRGPQPRFDWKATVYIMEFALQNLTVAESPDLRFACGVALKNQFGTEPPPLL